MKISTGPILHLIAFALLCCACNNNPRPINYLGQSPPGSTAQEFAPGILSTDKYEHSSPAFSPDGKVVLWTVVDKRYRGSMFEMRFENDKWSAPQRPTFADTTADDYYPSFSPDGKTLYFSSRRKMPPGYPNVEDMGIWKVEWNGSAWDQSIPVDTVVSRGHEYAQSIAANGALYTTSNWNVVRSAPVDGKYSAPQVLPYSINSTGYEDGPFVAPDESYLIFESNRPEGINNSIDLYITFKDPNGKWSLPLNMGPAVNSPYSERFAKLSPDGKYLFFGSTRNPSATSWGFDIYWIDARIIDSLRTLGQKNINEQLGSQLIDALTNDGENTGALLNEWLSENPDNVDATVQYSAFLRRRGRYQQAEELLAKNANNNAVITMEKALTKFGLTKEQEARELLSAVLVEHDALRDKYTYISDELLAMSLFDKSDDYFKKAMELFSSAYGYYRRAEAVAKKNEKTRAFEALHTAITMGYTTKNDYESNPNFQSLHSDPRWQGVVQKLKD